MILVAEKMLYSLQFTQCHCWIKVIFIFEIYCTIMVRFMKLHVYNQTNLCSWCCCCWLKLPIFPFFLWDYGKCDHHGCRQQIWKSGPPMWVLMWLEIWDCLILGVQKVVVPKTTNSKSEYVNINNMISGCSGTLLISDVKDWMLFWGK